MIPVRNVAWEWSVEQDDTPVRGNLIASGDDVADKADEDEVLARLERGDVWAWFCITVKGTYMGLSASTTLCGNSYDCQADIMAPRGMYYDLQYEILCQLEETIARYQACANAIASRVSL